jgi:hypothetical protein
MNKLLACAGLLLVAATISAQTPTPKPPPKSPTETASASIGGKTIKITYSSPGVKGREGHLFTKDGQIGKDPTYPVWRAGANAATAFHTDVDLNVHGLAVPAGDYTLYVDISDPDSWILVVNKQTGQWGTKYDKSQDLGRVKMKTDHLPQLVENLEYTIKVDGNSGGINLSWEHESAWVDIDVK